MSTATTQERSLVVQAEDGVSLHRFTAEEYEKFIALGALTPEDRVELLDGFLVDKMPQGTAHAYAIRKLSAHFFLRGQNRWITLGQLPVRVNGPWLPEPDIALVRPPEQAYKDRRPTAADTFLLIEVAESSLSIDRVAKLCAYARSGVPEYWVVNLPGSTVEVYRQPDVSAARYDAVRPFQPHEQLAPEQFPDAILSVRDIFS